MIAPIALTVCMFALWGLSLRLRDSSIVDLFWGPAFVVVAWVTVVEFDPTPRGLLVAGLVSVWGLRLVLSVAEVAAGEVEAEPESPDADEARDEQPAGSGIELDDGDPRDDDEGGTP